jgi:hypothetical protein
MTHRKQARFLGFTLLAASVALPAMAQWNQPRITVINAPGAGAVSSPVCAPFCGTVAFAMNDLGDVVGSYTDANIVPHGFLRRADGRYISFDAPGAGLGSGLDEGTFAYSINDLGVIAGQFEDSNTIYHGFIRDAYGFFTTFDAPGAGTKPNQGQGTYAFSINLEGATTGIYIDENNVYHGFARSPFGVITSFDPPGSVYTYPCQETCINFEGEITGAFQDASGILHAFVRDRDGKIVTFDAPGVGTGPGTFPASINPEGTIAGYLVDSNGMAHGFVRYPDGAFTTFNDPKEATPGVGTAPFSINPEGATAGEYFDASNISHGFERGPDGNFTTIDAPNAAGGTRPTMNNWPGAVTGYFFDANNMVHGFLWNPY